MTTNTINEDSFLFLPAANLCRGPLITCGPNLEVVAMAQQMRDHELPGLVVVAGGGLARRKAQDIIEY